MHVSRKADYAVRSLAYLASSPGRLVLISELAVEAGVPKAFLSKIMKQLVGGGLVLSQKGPGGGYRLSRPATEISFRDILLIVEGPWNLVPCQEEDGKPCSMLDNCSQVTVWNQIRSEMLEILGSYSLEGVKCEGSASALTLPPWMKE